ncbi:hypothetical protein BDV06DRAFT_125809 [Aspergillus oleicola]
MFAQSPCEYYGPMSFHPDTRGDELDPYYGNYNAHWPSSYETVNNPYNAPIAYQNPAILTPASLPDSSYAHTRTSPVVSHHSQEYQYPVSTDAMGLGITTPYPSELTQNATYGLEIAPLEYSSRESPAPASRRKTRRGSRQSVTREAPVTILPNPEQQRQLDQQRLRDRTQPERARAPARGRRNPEAEEEDAFVEMLRLKRFSWKEISRQFKQRFGREASEPSLQMRLNRRQNAQRARGWEEHDIQVLLRARDFWEREKFKLISQKMTEFGATTTFTPRQCEMQLDWIDSQAREREEQERDDNTEQQRQTDNKRKRRRANSAREPEENLAQNDRTTTRGRKRPRTTGA